MYRYLCTASVGVLTGSPYQYALPCSVPFPFPVSIPFAPFSPFLREAASLSLPFQSIHHPISFLCSFLSALHRHSLHTWSESRWRWDGVGAAVTCASFWARDGRGPDLPGTPSKPSPHCEYHGYIFPYAPTSCSPPSCSSCLFTSTRDSCLAGTHGARTIDRPYRQPAREHHLPSVPRPPPRVLPDLPRGPLLLLLRTLPLRPNPFPKNPALPADRPFRCYFFTSTRDLRTHHTHQVHQCARTSVHYRSVGKARYKMGGSYDRGQRRCEGDCGEGGGDTGCEGCEDGRA